MICIDDLNDWTGFLRGHPDVSTPNMDELAKRGRNFSNAHCAVPVCSSSRVSVMSGLLQQRMVVTKLGHDMTNYLRLMMFQQCNGILKITDITRCLVEKCFITDSPVGSLMRLINHWTRKGSTSPKCNEQAFAVERCLGLGSIPRCRCRNG